MLGLEISNYQISNNTFINTQESYRNSSFERNRNRKLELDSGSLAAYHGHFIE